MNLDRVVRVLSSGAKSDITTLLDDRETVFWVDWREEDDQIVDDCESILQTGDRSTELTETDDDSEGFEFKIVYKGRHQTVPLTMSEDDHHITLLALNELLKPEYEVRLCVASVGGDTLAFLPLSTRDWTELRQRFENTIDKHFYRLHESPNVFTDKLSFPME